MPFSIPPCIVQSKPSVLQQKLAEHGLEVLSYQTEVDTVYGYVIFKGGVRAKYGKSILTADELIVRDGVVTDPAVRVEEAGQVIMLRPKEAYAIGKVKVTDPDGSIQASNLWFTWDKARTENPNEISRIANLVEIQIGSGHIKADSMKLSSESWDFSKVSFWTSNWKTPLFRFDANSLHIVPDKVGVARGMKLTLLGIPFPTFPKY